MTEKLDTQEMIRLCKQHTLYTWAASGSVQPMPVERTEGIFIYEPGGKRYYDFNSQLMSVNIGHSHPKVISAMKRQLDTLLYTFPATATQARARLASKLAKLVPGDLNTFFFTLGGAEANENAIKAARLYTGRFKILSRYRSYHGATNATMQLTGDPRRLANEPGAPGFIKVMDPWPYHYSFGSSEEEITKNNLQYLEEVIMYEGADKIAAMFVETVTGTNGILPPPKGYIEGLRALLSKYGILMICDEVMCGWGRTGKRFAFEHSGIVPDILTMAKGLTSSYIPLGCMAVSDKIASHFQDNVFWGGLTYNSHALALATAEAVIDVMEEEGLIENAARLGLVMRSEMDRLQEKHPSVREGRCIGLFGMIDVQKNRHGDRIAGYNETHPAMTKLNHFFRDAGLFTFIRWGSFMCNPPLCITEEQLLECFAIVDKGLDITDSYFED
ncbi:MAG: aminotransferase class III-fold pyridoxal phosphate-dependent enzyme [Myxococcota bacterium]|nr:aminotransferase class III-fold pyridoxal phosphate-dependent enzyme [Myxococcota bacterium]